MGLKNENALKKAWESTRTYYTYKGIRDSRTGWTKRLGISPSAFGNRLALYEEGKLTKEQLFRQGPNRKIHKKREIRQSAKDRKKTIQKHISDLRKYHDSIPRVPSIAPIRVWTVVANAMKKLMGNQNWNSFFIKLFRLKIPLSQSKGGRPPKERMWNTRDIQPDYCTICVWKNVVDELKTIKERKKMSWNELFIDKLKLGIASPRG